MFFLLIFSSSFSIAQDAIDEAIKEVEAKSSSAAINKESTQKENAKKKLPQNSPTQELLGAQPSIGEVPQGTHDEYKFFCMKNGWRYDPKIKIGCIKD